MVYVTKIKSLRCHICNTSTCSDGCSSLCGFPLLGLKLLHVVVLMKVMLFATKNIIENEISTFTLFVLLCGKGKMNLKHNTRILSAQGKSDLVFTLDKVGVFLQNAPQDF